MKPIAGAVLLLAFSPPAIGTDQVSDGFACSTDIHSRPDRRHSRNVDCRVEGRRRILAAPDWWRRPARRGQGADRRRRAKGHAAYGAEAWQLHGADWLDEVARARH